MRKIKHGKESREKAAAAKARRTGLKFSSFANFLAAALIGGFIALSGFLAFCAYDLPDINKALEAARRPAILILAADGSELAAAGDFHGAPASLDSLPLALPQAVLATEDRRFYRHFGVDVIGLVRAAIANVKAGRIVQGGSTITQQVAKNLFLTPKRTIKRKAQEMLLALWLEHEFSKDQILGVYLNRVYLGNGAFGVAAAAQKYFSKPAQSLSTYEAAMLAGLLKAPSRYNPKDHPQAAAKRAVQVLDNMVAAGFLTSREAEIASRRKYSIPASAKNGGFARFFADWAAEQISGYVNPVDRDIVVTTTLDIRLQRLAEAKAAALMNAEGKNYNVSETALVAMNLDGAVRAMVGGRDYAKSQFNRATQALRQPGSAFKPFVFMAGLEAGLGPESQFVDEPVTIGNWRPENFSRQYLGAVSMSDALAGSINTVAARITGRVGLSSVIKTARRLGLTSELAAKPSLALGASEVNLTELTAAYAAFANGGFGVWPYAIVEIKDKSGAILYQRSGKGPGRVIDARHAAAMNAMLSKAIASGTGQAAALGLRPVAGKTGTSQNLRDAWFIGYSAELAAGVWMGNDDGAPMAGVTGGGLPAKLWRSFMAEALEGLPPSPLPGAGQAPAVKPGGKSFWERLLAGAMDAGG